MKISTIMAFTDEVEKLASAGLELAGLGMLAAPSIKHLATGKEMKEKHKSMSEVAGLGTLAAGTIKSVLSKKAMAKAAAKLKVSADMWNPETGNRSEEMHTRGSIAAKQQKPVSSPSPLKPASNIRGAPFKGAPVTNSIAKPMGSSAAASSGFKPRMATLGKVTAPAVTKTPGLLGKAMSFLGRK